jgi:hypothetical protein
MDAILLGVSWVDSVGQRWVDATTLLRLPNVLSSIRKERGSVRVIRWLENLPLS